MSFAARRFWGLALALFLACLAQAVWADSMRVWGARPDLLLLTGLIGSLFCDVNGAAGVGFCAGLLHASLVSPSVGFGSLIVSRMLVCIGIGWLEERMFRENAILSVFFVAGGTALAEVLFFFFAPQQNTLYWARHLGMTTLYNALLAMPVFWMVRWLVGAGRREYR